jgi:RecA-family ATPase
MSVTRRERQPLTYEQLCRLPDPTWLIADYLEEEALATLVGSSKAFKTFLALDWVLHVAYGLPWLGHPVRQGSAMYIAAEGRYGIKQRVTAWLQHHRQDIKGKRSTYRIIIDPVCLSNEDHVEELHEDLDRMPQPVKLIAFDTLARSMQGDENSAEDMGRIIAAASEFQRRHDSTVLLLHHTGWGNSQNGTSDRGRGSSALFGALDAEFVLKRNGTPYQTTLTNTKQKNHEEIAPTVLFLEKRLESLVIVRQAPRQALRDKVDAVSLFVSQNPKASIRQIAAATGVNRNTIARCVKDIRLKKKG